MSTSANGVPARVQSVLAREKLTVEQLREFSDEQLWQLSGLGPKCIAWIRGVEFRSDAEIAAHVRGAAAALADAIMEARRAGLLCSAGPHLSWGSDDDGEGRPVAPSLWLSVVRPL